MKSFIGGLALFVFVVVAFSDSDKCFNGDGMSAAEVEYHCQDFIQASHR